MGKPSDYLECLARFSKLQNVSQLTVGSAKLSPASHQAADVPVTKELISLTN
jgi:hypothetical protein